MAYGIRPLPMASPFFEFEQDFVGSLRCIPMVVRHRLDTCGVKLKLEHWNRFSTTERQALVDWPCDTSETAQSYRERLQALIVEHMGSPAKTLDISPAPPWQDASVIPAAVQAKFLEKKIPLSLQQWSSLTELKRFALIKLSRSSHENNNFLPAVQEFGLSTEQ